MFQPSSRRFITILSLTAALFLLPMTESQAAQRRLRGDSDFLDRVETRVHSLWRSIIGVWGMNGGRIDDNG